MMKRIKLGKLHLKEQTNGEFHLYMDGKSLHPISDRVKKLTKREAKNINFVVEMLSHYSPFVANTVTTEQNRKLALEQQLNLVYGELLRMHSLRQIINEVATDETLFVNRNYVGIHLTKDSEGNWQKHLKPLVYLPNHRKHIIDNAPNGFAVLTTRTPIKYLDLDTPIDFSNLYGKYLYVGKP